MNGVEKIEVTNSDANIDLVVSVSFSDGKEAKKIHRKVSQVLIESNEFMVTYATSNLTEMFG